MSMFLRAYISLKALLSPTSVFLVGDIPKDCNALICVSPSVQPPSYIEAGHTPRKMKHLQDPHVYLLNSNILAAADTSSASVAV